MVGGVFTSRICGLLAQLREDQDAFSTRNHMKDRASPVARARALAVFTLLQSENSPARYLRFASD